MIQTYEGCMYMDFRTDLLEERGYGEYERLPTSLLPPLWLAFVMVMAVPKTHAQSEDGTRGGAQAATPAHAERR